jgi:hypothetical protein
LRRIARCCNAAAKLNTFTMRQFAFEPPPLTRTIHGRRPVTHTLSRRYRRALGSHPNAPRSDSSVCAGKATRTPGRKLSAFCPSTPAEKLQPQPKTFGRVADFCWS